MTGRRGAGIWPFAVLIRIRLSNRLYRTSGFIWLFFGLPCGISVCFPFNLPSPVRNSAFFVSDFRSPLLPGQAGTQSASLLSWVRRVINRVVGELFFLFCKIEKIFLIFIEFGNFTYYNEISFQSRRVNRRKAASFQPAFSEATNDN